MSAAACDDLQARLDAMSELASHAAGQAARLLDELAAAPLPEDQAASERMVESLAAGLAMVGWCADAAATLGGQPPSRDGAEAWLLRPGLAEKLSAMQPPAARRRPAACAPAAGRDPARQGAPASAGRDAEPQKLRDAVRAIDAMAQDGFSEIAAIARLALAWLETPDGYRSAEVLAQALGAIHEKAGDAENCINCEAEAVGCNCVDAAQARREAAQRAARDVSFRERTEVAAAPVTLKKES